MHKVDKKLKIRMTDYVVFGIALLRWRFIIV